MTSYKYDPVIAVVIPCYRVTRHIISVIEGVGPEISLIYVVDDKCPDGSGVFVSNHCTDSRVHILSHDINQGVGGAVMTGYRAAIVDGADIIVKVDGDGQMDPRLIPYFIKPIQDGMADYTKGNRFYDLDDISSMPPIRVFGNTILSFMSKFSTGYWDLFDPTNGFTAIHADVAAHLPYAKISQRYFFETDILFRLNIMRAVVLDIPMTAKYADEESNLKISRVASEFFLKHLRNFFKRIFYNYYLRDLNLASFELPIGFISLLFGICYGVYHWLNAANSLEPTPAGVVMMAALPILTGLQFILAFLGYDISSVPKRARHLGRLKNFR
jgi:glycosyltransferase involved in cell wall biosynthesis